MKNIFCAISFFVGASANAGTCDLISGSFKTVAAQCYTIHNGGKFSDGYKEMRIAYDDAAKNLAVTMVSDRYSLSFKADGKEQMGRSQLEGDKYTAQCENNHAHTRAEMKELKHPLIRDYSINADGKLLYQESFEGDSSFVRVCEMDRL